LVRPVPPAGFGPAVTPAPSAPRPVAGSTPAVPGSAAHGAGQPASGAVHGPVLPVRSVRGTSVPSNGTPAPGRTAPPDVARVVQRAAASAGVSGVPLTAVPPRSPTVPAPAAEGAPPVGAQGGPAAGLDIDDLARRLAEPVGRLLRAEVRRGRERTGRPYDGRR
jgi:hypothetical protein